LLPPFFWLSVTLVTQLNSPAIWSWEKFYPGTGEYEAGNYTANDIKQSPVEPGFVLVGSMGMISARKAIIAK
jgi:hypothetical protein